MDASTCGSQDMSLLRCGIHAFSEFRVRQARRKLRSPHHVLACGGRFDGVPSLYGYADARSDVTAECFNEPLLPLNPGIQAYIRMPDDVGHDTVEFVLYDTELSHSKRIKRLKSKVSGEDATATAGDNQFTHTTNHANQPRQLAMAQHLARFGQVVLTPDMEAAFGSISRTTLQRLLQRFQRDRPKLPRREPQSPNSLLCEVPIGRLSWSIGCPVTFETDLMHHCGGVAVSEYLHTLQLVDIATGWSKHVAILGRSQVAMVGAFALAIMAEQKPPHPVRLFLTQAAVRHIVD